MNKSTATEGSRVLSRLAAVVVAAVAATTGYAGDSAPFLVDTAEGTRIAQAVEEKIGRAHV